MCGKYSKTSIFNTSPHVTRVEDNVAAMIIKVHSSKLLGTGLSAGLQSFSGQSATPEQKKDLLTFGKWV